MFSEADENKQQGLSCEVLLVRRHGKAPSFFLSFALLHKVTCLARSVTGSTGTTMRVCDVNARERSGFLVFDGIPAKGKMAIASHSDDD